jgi:hypothetical protein
MMDDGKRAARKAFQGYQASGTGREMGWADISYGIAKELADLVMGIG